MDRYKDAYRLCIDYLDENGISYDNEDVHSCIYSGKADNAILTQNDMGLSDIDFIFSIVDSYECIDDIFAEVERMKTPNGLLVSHTMDIIIKLKENVEDSDNITIQLVKDIEEKDYIIRIESRIKSIENNIIVYEDANSTGSDKDANSTSNNKDDDSARIYEEVNANIYSACLYDIIDIYNSVGDELFKKNVRLGIKKDSIGVGKEIKNTLNNHPEQFWFLNNGITIVTNFEIDKRKNDSIKLCMNEHERFSIVNGAQTVTAAHEFFFGKKYKDSREKAKEKARVLLRVVSVVNKQTQNDDSLNSMSEVISKSLNRQKPIMPEDLAYYSSFVKKVNQLYYNKTDGEGGVDDRLFAIIRRGEKDNDTAYVHSLPLVARAIRASGYRKSDKWEYEPWKAINTYNSSILKIIDGNELADKELFNTDDVENEKLFLARYQYVNLAIYLYDAYQRLKKKVYLEPKYAKSKIDVLKASGSWYFVTFFFKYILGHFEGDELISYYMREASVKINDSCIEKWMNLFFKGMDKAEDNKLYKVSDIRQANFYSGMDALYNTEELKMESEFVRGELLKKTDDKQSE